MGRQVLSDDRNNSKHQMTPSTVVAASVAIAAGNLVIWVGSTALATKNYVQIITALQRCRDAILEAGSPIPAATFEVIALCEPGETKGAVVVTNQAALPTITEADVFVGYGQTFLAGGGKLLFDQVNQAIDRFLEDQKAA